MRHGIDTVDPDDKLKEWVNKNLAQPETKRVSYVA